MPLSAVRPDLYAELLAEKVNAVCTILAPYSPPKPDVFPSQPTGFRLRAEFRMWHEGEDINYVMYRRDDPKTPVVVTDFAIADQRIQDVMPLLRETLRGNHILRHKLFQVEFLATLSGEFLVTLAYHRKLDLAWEAEAQILRATLQAIAPHLSIIGRSRKQKLVVGKDYVQEVLNVHGDSFRYRQYEQSFSQPNGQVNIQMIEWACEHAKELTGDLLELYCGNGNFTLPLARHFDSVIATELSKVSIRAARENLEENAVGNTILVRLSAEEVTQAINAVRVFRRLSDLPKPLDEYDLRTLFVDPPRAGLDADTVDMAQAFETILYISCNPLSLADNLQVLQNTHQIQHFALFDQFPYTDHMECGVVLRRT
jgi:tRNA (uracil-5-)-methyltransferase